MLGSADGDLKRRIKTVSSVLEEFDDLARSSDYLMLSYLLKMALVECREIASGKVKPASHDKRDVSSAQEINSSSTDKQ